MSEIVELNPADLCRVCDVDHFAFKTTAELAFTNKIIGQPRGTRSIEFGLDITSPGFNIYVLGPSGSGRTTTIERFLQERAASGPVPGDWVYVQNFEDPRSPRAICLPAGMGSQFQADLLALVDALKREIPRAFDTKEYKDALARLTQALETARGQLLREVQHQAAKDDFAIVRTPDGLMIAPLKDGQPMEAEVYEALAPEQREMLDGVRHNLERTLNDVLDQILAMEQDARDEIAALDRRVGASVADRFVEPLLARYAHQDEAALHLDLVRKDVVEQIDRFRPQQIPDEGPAGGPSADPFKRYQVNLVVDHGRTSGTPVIVESNPTYHNLVGRIEYEVLYGAPTTDFTNIKAGSLHRANGGYLVIRAADLLGLPYAWLALKRALNDRLIRIEEPAADSMATKTLTPEPMPLDIKIILMGSTAVYYSLYEVDEDFAKLFKVKADFDSEMARTVENELEYANFVAARCQQEGLRHLDRAAVGKLIEHGARMAGSQVKLATRFGEVANVIREASHWAGISGREVVAAEDVTRAIAERAYRSNMVEEKLRRQIRDGQILIDIQGSVVGQVNGLYVIQMGDYRFGQPSRITARTYMGQAGVVSIEREVKLAGPIHDRGVLTLAGYLGGRYAQQHPLSLSASLAFEQNYSGVDGDSASSAELYALLSSLSGYPINQAIAVTGSVNQRGKVQPVGGVTEKVEGFFAACSERGLTGEQGVIIPAVNVRDLMLNAEVLAAVATGKFHLWGVETIDQGLEILTGVPAGDLAADGSYPVGTVHHAVQKQLRTLATGLAAFGKEQR